jgi:hypothetical protein
MTTWIASTADGIAMWTGDRWTGDSAVREKVGIQLAQGPTIQAIPACPSFSSLEPIGPHAFLAALIREYGSDLIAPGAPFDEVVPPPPDEVSVG